MVFFFFLSLVLLWCSSVESQECFPFNATLTQPRVCSLSYNTPASNATSAVAADSLSLFFASLSIRPSKACAEAYATYYCNVHYPVCNSDNTVNPPCVAQCRAVYEACSDETDTAIFGNGFSLPASSECVGANPPPCSLPQANLTEYYANCGVFNISHYTSNQNAAICKPQYKVADLTPESYEKAQELIRLFAQLDTGSDEQNKIDEAMYPCLKGVSKLHCFDAMPACNSNEALPLLPICASVCTDAKAACAEIIGITCDETVVEPCYTPSNNDTDVGFFTGGDPPVPIAPTKAPDSEEPDEDNTNAPPGGFSAGGGIGAGVIVALLALIGLVTLIMKKQDNR